tara:strand:+ start:239 stop:610 length:372 start_codon:yes stop_codon:yes gene_type:complete
MDLFNQLIIDTEDVCSELPEKTTIISNLNNSIVKDAIIDVIKGEKSLEELKENKFPALLNEKNGILYGHKIRNCDKYFLVVWKESKLDAVIMNYDIKATGIVDSKFGDVLRNKQKENDKNSEN